jgi:hypothetical protein
MFTPPLEDDWDHDILLQKYSKNGNLLWQKSIGGKESINWPYAAIATKDGGVAFCGLYSYQQNYSWLVKTDSLGMDGLCNIEPDELNIDIDIPVLPEGVCMNDTMEVYVYISGKSAPYTIEFSTGQIIDSIYYPPCFVPVEIGLTDINLEWADETYFEETITEATLSNHEWGQCIVKPIEFYTPLTWGPQDLNITLTDAYGETKTITKEIFAVECSTNNDVSNNSKVRIYPNPVIGKLNVEIPRDYNFNYAEIYSSNGQLVLTHDLINGANTIDLESLFSGTYVIKLSDTNGNTESKVFEKIE